MNHQNPTGVNHQIIVNHLHPQRVKSEPPHDSNEPAWSESHESLESRVWLAWIMRIRYDWIPWIFLIHLTPPGPNPECPLNPPSLNLLSLTESFQSSLVSPNSLDMTPLHLTEYPWTTWVPWIWISWMNSVHMNFLKSQMNPLYLNLLNPVSRQSCGCVIVSKLTVILWAITIFWTARHVSHLSLNHSNHPE